MGNTEFKTTLRSTGVENIHHIMLGGNQSTTVCAPPEMNNQPGSTSPHHLFLAAVGACVDLIFEIALRKARIEVHSIQSEITGDYETDEETGQSSFSAITIDTEVVVPEGIKHAKIERLFDIAHENCPIGNCLIGSCVKLLTNLTIIHK